MSYESETRNDDICPNCMEPVAGGAAVCPCCGASMTESEPAGEIQPTESASEAINDSGGAEDAGTSGPQGESGGAKKPNVMQNITRGMGVYLIYIAITNGYRVVSDPAALELEIGTKEYWLALVSNVIYLAAGLLAVWPWIREYLDKRKRIEDAAVVEGSAVTIENGPESEAGVDPEGDRLADEPEGGAETEERTE